LGRPIKENYEACHECNVRTCIRVGPGHIYEGTRQQNCDDTRKSNVLKGTNNILSIENVVKIKKMILEGYDNIEISKIIGVTTPQVENIKAESCWSWISVDLNKLPKKRNSSVPVAEQSEATPPSGNGILQ